MNGNKVAVGLLLLVGAFGCAEEREVVLYYAPVFDASRENVRYVRLTANERPPRAPRPIGGRLPERRSARVVLETVPVDGGPTRPGPVLWSANGRRVHHLASAWQIESKNAVEVGLCLGDRDGTPVSVRRVTVSRDGRRILSEHAAPATRHECPSRESVQLHQPSVFHDSRRLEVLAPAPRPHHYPRSAGVLLYDWEGDEFRVLAGPPAPLALPFRRIREELERSDTPLRWRGRPARAVEAVRVWVPPDAHPRAPRVSDVIAFRSFHSAWTWLAPEWNREYRGGETWKITARFERRRLDGRSHRLAAAWIVRFDHPFGPRVAPRGPNARRLTWLRAEEAAGIRDPGASSVMEVEEGVVRIRGPWPEAAPGDRLIVHLHCGSAFLGESRAAFAPDGTPPFSITFPRSTHRCGSRYHWDGPWIEPAGQSPGKSWKARVLPGGFVLDADDAFVVR